MCKYKNRESRFMILLESIRGKKSIEHSKNIYDLSMDLLESPWEDVEDKKKYLVKEISDTLKNELKITDPQKRSKVLNWLLNAKRLDHPNDKDFKMVINWLKKNHYRIRKDL